MFKRKILCVVALLGMGLTGLNAQAELLEIPKITDSTPLKGKSVYENMDVPPVRERDPNPLAGPRIWVLEIKVQGVVERPEYRIVKKDIDAYVENLRRIAMREEELLNLGYSLEDLAEIADLMVEIDATNNMEGVTEPDVQRLIWLVREQKERRGLTLGQIEEIANQLTNYYRKRGFFLTKVFIPEQQVRDGVVGLTVLEGKLGKVTVEGNKNYSADLIASAFDELMYQPVNERDIEQKLYLLNDYPGLNVYGYFKAGDQVGDTHLTVEVRSEETWAGLVRYDNHGSDLTGRQRLYAQLQWLNPTHMADEFTLGVLQTFDPDNSTYGMAKYRIPLFSEALYAGLNYSQNQFVMGDPRATGGIESLGLSGETTVTDFSVEYSAIRRREKSWMASFRYANKKSEIDSEKFPTINRQLNDKVDTYALDSTYDVLNETSKTLLQLKTAFLMGDIKEGANEGQDERFYKFNLDASYLSFLSMPWIETPTRLIIKSSFQYSQEALPPVEQSSLAGPSAVRAFPVTQYSTDSMLYLGLDWILKFPEFMDFDVARNTKFTQLAQPFVFLDYAYGELNAYGNVSSQDAQLSGYGIGIQLNYKNQLAGNLQFAKPISSSFSDASVEKPESDIKVIADLQYVF